MNSKLISIANKLYSSLNKDEIAEIYKDIKLSSVYENNKMLIS